MNDRQYRMMKLKKEEIEQMDFEIRFCEGLLQKRSDFTEVLGLLGDLYTKRGFLTKGLQADKRLAKLKPKDPVVFYNLACSYSLLDQMDEAFDTIKKALSYGYTDFKHLERDKDLIKLRRDKRFKNFYSQLINISEMHNG